MYGQKRWKGKWNHCKKEVGGRSLTRGESSGGRVIVDT